MKKLFKLTVRPGTIGAAAGCLLLAVALMTGCGQKPAGGGTNTIPVNPYFGLYFHAPFQTESEFIVRAIVSDLAEQMYFAAKHQLPDTNTFQVTATEKPGTPRDEPVYILKIRLDSTIPELDEEVTINGPIWSAKVYADVASHLAQAAGLAVKPSPSRSDTALMARLTDGSPKTIEQENQRLSADLEKNFTDPELHEQAALLLGAFMLRDHSGFFLDLRSPLCRLTAHLAMAQFLRASEAAGLNGRMAETLMLTLAGDEAPAVTLLKDIGTNNSDALPLVRALLARNTGDYRQLEQLSGLSKVEALEGFYARANYISTASAWPKLTDAQKQTIDFVRAADDLGFSVEVGHELLNSALTLEMQEIQDVYTLAHGNALAETNFITALNEMPDRCFAGSGAEVHVHVIGWGQWAEFLQRHLCHAVQRNFNMLNHMWGVPDDAKQFASQCDTQFDGLRLYPFVRRFNCTDVESYHKSVDDGFKVTVETPQLVPADCWNELCYKVNFAPWYNPNPNPHINEWHTHNPPPGTVYNLHPRLNHPSLVDRPDAMARFQQLHELAPYDCRIGNFLLEHQYHDRATFEQASNLFTAVLAYSPNALRSLARTAYYEPAQYESVMLQAAAIDPTCYYDLGDYEIDHHKDDDGAKYIEAACIGDPDSVRIANVSLWRVKYYLKKGDIEQARQIADFAAEVYSARGLEAKAYFCEATTNYDEAFNWHQKNEERYEDSGPLVSFCMRYKNLTGDTRYDAELQKREEKYFPGGIKNVSLTDLSGQPADGVSILQQNDLLTAAGMSTNDVIVALNGIRIHSSDQYSMVRGTLVKPEMDLFVWQRASGYREVKASPPDYRFGVDIGNYKSP
jgi:hypothetical protein